MPSREERGGAPEHPGCCGVSSTHRAVPTSCGPRERRALRARLFWRRPRGSACAPRSTQKRRFARAPSDPDHPPSPPPPGAAPRTPPLLGTWLRQPSLPGPPPHQTARRRRLQHRGKHHRALRRPPPGGASGRALARGQQSDRAPLPARRRQPLRTTQ
jgi:hypothetical protein